MIGDNFQRKKEDIRSSSIRTRSKAHDTIKRMLASLGDPYTRFLSPEEVIHYLSPLFLSVFSLFFLSFFFFQYLLFTEKHTTSFKIMIHCA